MESVEWFNGRGTVETPTPSHALPCAILETGGKQSFYIGRIFSERGVGALPMPMTVPRQFSSDPVNSDRFNISSGAALV